MPLVTLCTPYFRAWISQIIRFLVCESAFNSQVISDNSTQVLHTAIDKVILCFYCLGEVLENQINLRRLFFSLVCHVACVELPKHVIFTLHLAHLRGLRCNFWFSFPELCFNSLKFFWGRNKAVLHSLVLFCQCAALLVVLYALISGHGGVLLENGWLFGGAHLEPFKISLQGLIMHQQVLTIFYRLLIKLFMLLHLLTSLAEVL